MNNKIKEKIEDAICEILIHANDGECPYSGDTDCVDCLKKVKFELYKESTN